MFPYRGVRALGCTEGLCGFSPFLFLQRRCVFLRVYYVCKFPASTNPVLRACCALLAPQSHH